MTQQFLLVDLDGAAAEFVIGEAGRPLGPSTIVACHDQAELIDQLKSELGETLGRIDAAAFAAPGPVVSGSLQLTHRTMRLEREALGWGLGIGRVELVNDFAARATAMPVLGPDQMELIGGEPPRSQDPAVAVGPSRTGLGVSMLNPDGFIGWVAVGGEGGHAELAAADHREAEIIEVLRRTEAYVSPDRVLSEAGVVEVCGALHLLAGQADAPCEIGDLVLAARGADPIALETFTVFSTWLGAVAGDLALVAGARSGAYIISPVMLNWIDLFDREACRRRFAAKGRMSHFMADIPLFLVTERRCGLLGLAARLASARF